MNVTFVPIPAYSNATRKGNYNPGREGKSVTTFVYHWIAGNQKGADTVFTNPASVKSAHFSVEDESVHQYVRLQDTSFNAGRYDVNLVSVGIEHSAQPGRDASDLTYETSARLVAETARALGKRVADFQHLRHNQVKATACPGTLDVGRIVARAIEIEEGTGAIEIIPASAEIVPAAPEPFEVTVTVPKLNVRVAPGQYATVRQDKALYKGNRLMVAAAVTGDPVDGDATWLRTEVSGLYVWAGGTSYQQPTNQA